MISILLGCGLRRAELSALTVEDMQVRQGHWAIVDLVGKGGHVRTVPMPHWVKEAVDHWMTKAEVNAGQSFEPLAVTIHLGERESPKTSSGTWFGVAPNGYSWTILPRTTFAEHAQSSVI